MLPGASHQQATRQTVYTCWVNHTPISPRSLARVSAITAASNPKWIFKFIFTLPGWNKVFHREPWIWLVRLVRESFLPRKFRTQCQVVLQKKLPPLVLQVREGSKEQYSKSQENKWMWWLVLSCIMLAGYPSIEAFTDVCSHWTTLHMCESASPMMFPIKMKSLGWWQPLGQVQQLDLTSDCFLWWWWRIRYIGKNQRDQHQYSTKSG